MKMALKKVEGSPADMKMDKRLATNMMHKSKVKAAATRAFGGR